MWPELMECNCLVREQKIYFFARNFNALCKINLIDGIVDAVASIRDEKFDEEFLVTNLWEYKGEILCIPYMASQIHIINLEKEQDSGFIKTGNNSLFQGNFYSVYQDNKDFYIFPFTGGDLVRIDMEKKEVTKKISLRKAYCRFSGTEYSYFSYSRCYTYQKRIYLAMYDVAVIVEYAISSGQINFYRFDGDSSFYIHVNGCEQYLYVLGNNGRIYVWNVISHKLDKMLKVELAENDRQRYTHSVNKGKYIYIFKYISSDEIIRIDTELRQVEVLSLISLFHLENQMNQCLTYMTEADGKLFFISKKHELYVMDQGTELINIIPMKLDEQKMTRFILTHKNELSCKSEGIIQEGACIWTLKNYIKQYVEISNDKKPHETDGAGYNIYRMTNSSIPK